jgi:Protein of unknown function (DUF2793)
MAGENRTDLIMDKTPNLALPYLLASQAQKHVTLNESLRVLDAVIQISIADRDATQPPAEPGDGERYIVAAGATGEWVGRDDMLATWLDGAWIFQTPSEGWIAWVRDEDAALVFDGVQWKPLAAGGSGEAASINPAPLVGVNGTADEYNRLLAKTDGVLFSHDDVTPGSGDIRIIVNKADVAATASLIFQSGYSGRAEFGLAGDDHWRVKVSADGSLWHEALHVDPASGRVTMPNTPVSGSSGRELLTADRTLFVRQDGNDANDGLSDDPAGALASIQAALDRAYGAVDLNGYNVTVQIAAGVYQEDIVVSAPQVGAGNIILSGDIETPANVVIQAQQTAIAVRGPATRLAVRGVKAIAAGNDCWFAERGGVIEAAGKNEMGPAGRHHLIAEGTSAIFLDSQLIVSGSCAGAHIRADNGGFIDIRNARWELTGIPEFGYFAYAIKCGVIVAAANIFTGSATGMRYWAEYNGVIDTGTGSNNYFPGNTAGDFARGGRYI